MEETLRVGDANDEGVRPLDVLWPATIIVTGSSSFMIFFIRGSILPIRSLSTKCDDGSQSVAMVNAWEPGGGTTATVQYRGRSSSQAPAPSVALAGSRGTLATIDRR